MAVKGYVIKSPKVFLGGYDLSGNHNKIRYGITRNEESGNQFGLETVRLPGLLDLQFEHSGLWEANAIDAVEDVLHGNLGTADQILTVCPKTGAAQGIAYFSKVSSFKYEINGKIGGKIAFSGAAKAQGDPIFRGTILKNGSITASGSGTLYELGAVGEDEYLYAVLHVTSTSGAANRTLDVEIKSYDYGGGTPTTRITFSQVTTNVSGQYAVAVPGPITDTYWLASYTRGGTSGTFQAFVAMAIQ